MAYNSCCNTNCKCCNTNCCAPAVSIGTTTTGVPGTNAVVTNSGNNCNAVLNFTIPAGVPGANGTDGADGLNASVTVGTTTTGAPGTSAIVTNTGTPQDAILNFTIPAGVPGANGADGADGLNASVTVGTTTTGAPGTSAIVTNTGTSQDAILNFTIPAGVPGTNGTDGADGLNASVTVGTTTTGAPGTSATVTNTGTSQDVILNFTIPAGENGSLSSEYGIFTSPSSSVTSGTNAVFTEVSSTDAVSLDASGTTITLAAGGIYSVSYIFNGTASSYLEVTPTENGSANTFASQRNTSATTDTGLLSVSGTYYIDALSNTVALSLNITTEDTSVTGLTGILSVSEIHTV